MDIVDSVFVNQTVSMAVKCSNKCTSMYLLNKTPSGEVVCFDINLEYLWSQTFNGLIKLP